MLNQIQSTWVKGQLGSIGGWSNFKTSVDMFIYFFFFCIARLENFDRPIEDVGKLLEGQQF